MNNCNLLLQAAVLLGGDNKQFSHNAFCALILSNDRKKVPRIDVKEVHLFNHQV
jgi:hypothetical protein